MAAFSVLLNVEPMNPRSALVPVGHRVHVRDRYRRHFFDDIATPVAS
jgi:hypothetical protein